MPSPPPGTNVTYFTGTDTLTAPAADVISGVQVIFTWPVPVNGGISYITSDEYVFGNLSQFPGTNISFGNRLTEILTNVLSNAAWDDVYDPASRNTTTLVAGENIGTMDAGISLALIDITTVGASVDYWWGSSNFAKFGTFLFGNPIQFGPANFVNTKHQQFSLPGRQTADQWYCNLQPGCSGTITTAKRQAPPAITWTSPQLGPGSLTPPFFG